MERDPSKVGQAVLVAVTVIGFGLLRGSRLLDLGSGPYSAEPYAIAGIAAGALAYLHVAVMSYAGRLSWALSILCWTKVFASYRLVDEHDCLSARVHSEHLDRPLCGVAVSRCTLLLNFFCFM